jgi:hypothetical protein
MFRGLDPIFVVLISGFSILSFVSTDALPSPVHARWKLEMRTEGMQLSVCTGYAVGAPPYYGGGSALEPPPTFRAPARFYGGQVSTTEGEDISIMVDLARPCKKTRQ